jgi:RimJ/RimL family protein N-acetyltransferase
MDAMRDPSAPMLRDVIEADLPVFFEQQCDPIATRMAAFVSREREAFMVHWHDMVLRNPTNTTKTVVVDGRVAGHVVSWEHGRKRLVGYWIGREHWGKGIATRALAEFLAREATRPLHAWVAVDNVASIRVLEKCGFCRDPTTGLHTGDDGVVEVLMMLATPPASPPSTA